MPLKLVKRKGQVSWYVRGTVRGQTIRESCGTDRRDLAEAFRTKREAELYEAAIFGERAVVSFEHAAREYLSFETRNATTRFFVERLIRHFGSMLLGKISQTEAERAVNYLVGSKAAPATKVRGVYTPLTAVLTFAAFRGWCVRPMFDKPAVPKGGTRWLAPAEAVALIGAASPHLRPLLRFLLCTGARLSEALDLEWKDVDLAAGVAVLRGVKARVGQERDRVVALPPLCTVALANIPFTDPAAQTRAGPVFLCDDGKPYTDHERLSGGQIKTAWHTACRRAGVEDATPHDCRHTWATYMYALTKDMMLLRDKGGWSSTKMVERYAHLMPSALLPEISRVWGASHAWVGDLPKPAHNPALVLIDGEKPA